jgi:hypothetical protein
MKLDIVFNADELSPEWAAIMKGVDRNAKNTRLLKRTKSNLNKQRK